MVASAPVGTGRGRAIAGRQAEYHMDAIHAREEAAVSREKALRAEGEVLRREEARITQLKNRLLEGLETMDQASTDVRRVLQRRRADLAALNVEGNFHENSMSTPVMTLAFKRLGYQKSLSQIGSAIQFSFERSLPRSQPTKSLLKLTSSQLTRSLRLSTA